MPAITGGLRGPLLYEYIASLGSPLRRAAILRSQRFTISPTGCRRGAIALTHPPPHLQVLGSGKPRLSDSLAQSQMPRGRRPQEVRRGRPLAPSCSFQPPTTLRDLLDDLSVDPFCRHGSWSSWLRYWTADAGRKQLARTAADGRLLRLVKNCANFRLERLSEAGQPGHCHR